MKITTKTIIYGIILFAVINTVSAYEKAIIYFKNGEQLDCIVEKYEPGKWADIIEPSGAKKTLKWDIINVIYFKKEEATQDDLVPVAEPPAAVNSGIGSVSSEVIPEPVSVSESTEPEPMNLAQKLAKKERERKEQEALAAKKSSEPAAASDTKIVKPAQPPVQKPVQAPVQKEIIKQEKATLIYANGDKLDCIIEQYELGKWAVVIDETGTKRIISWDTIKEIIFVKENTPSKSAEETSSLPAIATAPVVPAASPTPAAAVVDEKGSGSMLDTFKKKPAQAEPEKPVNVKEEAFKEEIREENKYQQKPEIDYDKDSGKMGVSLYKTLESDATRRAWIEDGGVLKGKGFTANYTYASMEFDGDTDLTMHGFGMTYSGTLKWIKPPSYAENKNLWTAFSLGAVGSFNITFGSIEMEMIGFNWSTYESYTYNAEMNMTLLNYEISVPVGYTFGLGRYFSPDSWKGVMLGLYWKPNFVLSMATVEMDGVVMDPTVDTAFNFGGMQWTIDWGSFGALADRIANEAHFSINGYIIPETDVTPFMLSIGLGLVYY